MPVLNTHKKSLLLIALCLVSCITLCGCSQKSAALKSIRAYMNKQGVPINQIESKTIKKDFKQGGYQEEVTLKNDPGIDYLYIYSSLYKNSYRHVNLNCFRDNFSYGIDTGMKYKPIPDGK
ncbi:MAG: DUF3139 domain-containing protein [Sporolactobacillus sp.]